MKQTALILILTAGTLAASAQTPAPPAASPAKPATAAAKPAGAATAAKPAIAAAKPATAAVVNPNIAPIIKAPAKIPPVKGLQKTLFTTALRYQDVKAGDGASAESGKLAKCLFTLWLEDGSVFDSTTIIAPRCWTRITSRLWAMTANPSSAILSRFPS